MDATNLRPSIREQATLLLCLGFIIMLVAQTSTIQHHIGHIAYTRSSSGRESHNTCTNRNGGVWL
jgi:hypothetical protein